MLGADTRRGLECLKSASGRQAGSRAQDACTYVNSSESCHIAGHPEMTLYGPLRNLDFPASHVPHHSSQCQEERQQSEAHGTQPNLI